MRRLQRTAALDAAGLRRALDRLHETVRARGLKSSAVRDAVARAALQHAGHFSVDDLVRELRGSGVADAHPATVYRVLPLLVEAGLVQVTLMSAGDGGGWPGAELVPARPRAVAWDRGMGVRPGHKRVARRCFR